MDKEILIEDIEDMEKSKQQAYDDLMSAIAWYENRSIGLAVMRNRLSELQNE